MRLRTEHQRAWAANNLARKRAGLQPEPYKPEIKTEFRTQCKQPTGVNFVKFLRGEHVPATPTQPQTQTIEDTKAIERLAKPKRKRNPKPR